MKPEDLTKITDVAREMILDYGSAMPTLFVDTKDEGIVAIPLPQFTEKTKHGMMFMLGLAFRKKKVNSVAFVSEAWMVRVGEGESMPEPPLSEHPKREEILCLIWGRKGNYQSKAYIIEKTPDGPLFSDMGEPDRVESRLLDRFFEGLGGGELCRSIRL